MVPTKYGQVETRLFCPRQIAQRRYFICMEAVLFSAIRYPRSHHAPAGKLQPMYGDCIDYTLSPEARFPQAIEEIVVLVVISTSRRRIIKSICPALLCR